MDRFHYSFSECTFPESPVGNRGEVLDEQLLLDRNTLTKKLLERYQKYRSSRNFRSGVYHLYNQKVFDNWGLVLSQAEGSLLNGSDGFGWPKGAFEFMARKGLLQLVDDSGGVLRFPDLVFDRTSRAAALLTFPGALTYGHWIVDIWGRIEILKRSGLFWKIEHFILPAPHRDWMNRFLKLFEIDESRVFLVDKVNGVFCEELFVPTVPTQSPGGIIPPELARSIFRPTASFINSWTLCPRDADRAPLFIIHKHLTSSRRRLLANADQVAQAVIEIGGRVIDPLEVEIGELLAEIRRASVVIGQDSSALHNLAFVGRDLIVIETEPRANLLHFCIQDALQNRITYVGARWIDEGWVVELDEIKRMLLSISLSSK